MAKNQVIVSVMADVKDFQKHMKQISNTDGFDKLSNRLHKVGNAIKVVTAAAAAGTVALATKAIKSAADLEQSMGTIDDIFGASSKQMHAWSQSAAKNVGLSRNEFNELGALIGAQLKNGGTSMEELGGKTYDLIKTGADLAAGFGGSTREAVEAISSALKGERDPIERYGVSLKQSAIDAEAAALGFTKVGGSFSNEAQQAATLSLIMKQTSDMHGKFARESDTLQHKVEVLKANLENMTTTLGTHLVPVVSTVVGWFSEKLDGAFTAVSSWIQQYGVPVFNQLKERLAALAPKIQEIASGAGGILTGAFKTLGTFLINTVLPAFVRLAEIIVNNWDKIVALTAAVVAAVAAYKTISTIMTVVKTIQTVVTAFTALKNAMGLAKAAQIALNLAMSANPIGLVITLIAGIVAAIVTFIATNENARNKVKEVWEKIKSAVSGFVEFFKGIPNKIADFLRSLKDKLIEKGRAAINGLKDGAVAAFQFFWNWYTFIPRKIWEALTALPDWLRSTGKNMIDGLKNGATEKVYNLLNFIRGIPSSILQWLGNGGSLLRQVGRNIITGFINGITDMFNSVRNRLSQLTNMLPSWKGPAKRDKTLLTPAGKLIMQSLVDGIRNGQAGVKQELGSLTRWLSGSLDGVDLGSPSLAAATTGGYITNPAYASQATQPVTINVQVPALSTSLEVGKAVEDALKVYGRQTGRTLSWQ